MSGAASTVVGMVGVGVILVAVLRSAGRRAFVVVSGGGLLALLVVAVLLGYAGA
jgi:hypothetical protein